MDRVIGLIHIHRMDNRVQVPPNRSMQREPRNALPAAIPADILTLSQISAELHTSKAHVCNIVAGKVKGVHPLPVIRLGRRTLVRRSTFERWKECCENTH